MIIDKSTLSVLIESAKQSPRKRMNLDLRNSNEDTSQRMLNALEPDTILPIHRHNSTSETIIVLRGSIKQCLYDNQGRLVESYIFKAGNDSLGMNVPAGQWHNTIALESGTVIFETKDGSYYPLTSEDILNNENFSYRS